ncbi:MULTISPECIES: hypothetical protein [Haloferax]|uniref:hypothetical protein n=1 Tax=Haloferax TaxID=2251 RepID=UPI000679A53A|nr:MULTISPECIES: hypothetical protein [Haloferax]RDZ42064.1 hypothetical protein C5B86_15285 [Haloferax sp. Atlit-19N]RDZ42351.1 hypothetical protein C5B87_15560 [Haloferax sp. Atlit-16N]RDZ50632.1 hypothetical protein C5C07_17580 [Haloferax sp. Atlit-4N]RDZ57224.1 hypothetical protein C5B91_14730 [Haloferax sp. Atlit-10N]REA01437.1 hypothetical protein DEQ92_16100 [Haloferax sp. Atlit-6N]
MSVALDIGIARTVDKSHYDGLFGSIISDKFEMSHDSTGTASCYLPCHTASKLPCCDTTN